MLQGHSWFAFHDLTARSNYLYISATMTDVLGRTSEELIGTSPFDRILPEDAALSQTILSGTVVNDLVSSQAVLRLRAKDGTPVACICVVCTCYDFVLSCTTVLDPNIGEYMQFGGHSSMNQTVRSKEGYDRLKRHHKAFAANSGAWDSQELELEPRVCMILNRYTRSLIVMYASAACKILFNIDPEQIEGKPILLFVRADELGPFVEQVDVSKSSQALVHLRFWFQSPNLLYAVPVEAILFGSADGIVAVMRQCRPFTRRHLIGNREYYNPINNRNHQDSPRSSPSIISPSTMPPSIILPLGMSLASSVSFSSPSPRPSMSQHLNVTRSTLKDIRIVDRIDGNVRPLEDVAKVNPALAQDVNTITIERGIKELNLQEYVEESDEEDYIEDLGEYERAEDFESAGSQYTSRWTS